MESLNYAFEGREPLLFTDDAHLPIDNFITSRKTTANSVESMGFISDTRLKPVRGDHQFFENPVQDSEKYSGNMVLPKRARTADLKSQTPYCQVYGCNKDLSGSKDYHKRHKVCDVHSKTPVVIVNGIQQRFCQQCSRFHIVAEFDEGKRSCRKRLAGHNERRRKPQFNTPVFGSSTFLGSDLSKTSLLFSGILPSRFFGSELHEPTKDNMNIKLEQEENTRVSQLALPLEISHTSVNERLSMSSISSCALSLLSSQSQNITNNSMTVSLNHPLVFRQGKNLKKLRKLELEKGTVSNTFDSFNGFDHEGLPLISTNSIESLNLKHCPSQESGNTVDLVELSLHLQRIEQQKYDCSGQDARR